MSHIITKPTNWHVCPAMTQITMGILPVWSVFTQWAANGPRFLHAGRSDWTDAQTDPSLCWAHRSFCWFCCDVAQINCSVPLFSTRCFPPVFPVPIKCLCSPILMLNLDPQCYPSIKVFSTLGRASRITTFSPWLSHLYINGQEQLPSSYMHNVTDQLLIKLTLSRSTTKPTKWCAPSKGSDQTAHHHSLIRVSALNE